jgi:prepilin-type N-terminal cleavage/methylation domain-containing protein/prepilin-type processing-associated H-X9-DG protein
MSPSVKSVSRRSGKRAGFTLVELLVVIGIIAILISILLPALQRARDASATIKCAANVRSMVQGVLAYAAENKQYLPAAYGYRGTTVNTAVANATGQQPQAAAYGYNHWSALMFGTVPPDSFQCPAITNGGLPATDPGINAGGFDAGQVIDSNDKGSNTLPSSLIGRVTAITQVDGVGNSQTYYPDDYGRIAYTANEVLMPRNKFIIGYQNATRTYRSARLTEIGNQPGTILITEFVDSADIVSGATVGATTRTCKSHRPVSGWRAEGSGVGDLDKDNSGANLCDPCEILTTVKLRHTVATDLWLNSDGSQSLDIITDAQKGNYSTSGTSRGTRLDWVGRNHGFGAKPADKKSNFGYLDGHVETKSILETLPAAANADGTIPATPWEWGDKDYTISPNQISSTQLLP